MSYNRFRVAIDIQDASNIRAIAREFVKVVDDAHGQTSDPAVILLVNKIVSMLPDTGAAFSDAWAEAYVQAVAREKETNGDAS